MDGDSRGHKAEESPKGDEESKTKTVKEEEDLTFKSVIEDKATAS
jgi:hypothetical protein